MIFKNISDTNLNTSSICLGTASFGSTIDKKNSFELLDCFISEGGNFIDTAHVYANWLPGEKSASEKTIGRWIKERKNRSKVIIATKGASLDEITGMPRLSHDEIVNDLNKSLEFLQTDYIDLYWLHRDNSNHPVSDILETLNEQVIKGKIKYLGCSNWEVQRIKEARDYASKHGLKCFVGNQMMWSLAVPNANGIADKTMKLMNSSGIQFHKNTNLAAIPYSSQAGGFFTKLSNGTATQLNETQKTIYYNEENIKRLKRLQKLSNDLSVSVSTLVLSYLTSQPFTTIPIVGCRTIEQLTDSLKATNLILSANQISFLDGTTNTNV